MMSNYTVNIEKGRGTVTLPAYLLPVGIHTMRVVYNQSEHYYTCKTSKHALLVDNYNKNYYDTVEWTGTPVIDKSNRKITINGRNITYIKQMLICWDEIIYVNQYWMGNPTIDVDNKKITIEGKNIAYLQQFDSPMIENVYNTDDWTGNPTIDVDNKKITIEGKNITYLQRVEE